MPQSPEPSTSILTSILAVAVPLGLAFLSWRIPSCIQEQKAREEHELLVLGGSTEEYEAASLAYKAEVYRLEISLDSFVVARPTLLIYGNDSLTPEAHAVPIVNWRRLQETDPYERAIVAIQRRGEVLAAWSNDPGGNGVEVIGHDHDGAEVRLALLKADTAAPAYLVRLRYRIPPEDQARLREFLDEMPALGESASAFGISYVDPTEPQVEDAVITEAELASGSPASAYADWPRDIDLGDTSHYFTFAPYNHRPDGEAFAAAVERFEANFLGGVEAPRARVRQVTLVPMAVGGAAE